MRYGFLGLTAAMGLLMVVVGISGVGPRRTRANPQATATPVLQDPKFDVNTNCPITAGETIKVKVATTVPEEIRRAKVYFIDPRGAVLKQQPIHPLPGKAQKPTRAARDAGLWTLEVKHPAEPGACDPGEEQPCTVPYAGLIETLRCEVRP